MMKIAMSRPASALLSALLARCPEERDRILLSEVRSVDWQSLTFVGERHRMELRIIGDRSLELAERLTCGIEHAEFTLRGHFVADIAVAGEPRQEPDGGLTVTIEALTIAE
jgi:hypothetical protein